MPAIIRSISANTTSSTRPANIIRKRPVRMKVNQLECAKKAWKDGATGPQLAKAYDVSVETIYAKVSDKKRAFHRITPGEKVEMRRLREDGMSVERIAKRFNCCEATVKKYTWPCSELERRNKIKRNVIRAYTRNHQENMMAGTTSNAAASRRMSYMEAI